MLPNIIQLNDFKNILKDFDTISLKEMGRVRLMDRIDTKFIFSADKLSDLLKVSKDNYFILKQNSRSVFTYYNIYFDTPDLHMYNVHHNRHLNRYKVRFREYVDSEKKFLEVKFKNNKRRTIKTRMEVPEITETIKGDLADFIDQQTPYSGKHLLPRITNNYSRVTLVHKKIKERITIDTNLVLEGQGKTFNIPFLAIAEVKQSRFSSGSDFVDLLIKNRIFPEGLSKYLLGVALTHPGVKYNRYKPKLLVLKRISHDKFKHQLIS